MNYILNTKTKTVEIFWKDEEEYKAIMELLMNFKISEPELHVEELLQPNYTNIYGFGSSKTINCSDNIKVNNPCLHD